MGPHVLDGPADGPAHDPLRHFVLKPFRSSQTYRNLKGHGEGVLHVVDDVLLLAQAAVGTPEPFPEVRPAQHVRGFVLADACRYAEFRVTACDDRAERATVQVEVAHVGRLRDFFGFNRARHAVLEAAILATRTALLPPEQIEQELARLAVPVEKTGGPREKAAFVLLRRHVEEARRRGRGPQG
jgi:hypothetical protein